jgi:hypothetical protein
MTRTKPFAALAAAAKADSVRRERIAAYERTIDDALALAVWRACRGLTQQEVARTLEATQVNCSRGDDLHRSVLQAYLAAWRGEFPVRSVFPDRHGRGGNGQR